MYEAPFSNQYACMLVTICTLLSQASVGSEQNSDDDEAQISLKEETFASDGSRR
ncbi:MAG: hypothetical protein LBQ08_00475 [Holosporaceae bacterium]|nr:hypothetical protein [Holosporaceae bacterium]